MWHWGRFCEILWDQVRGDENQQFELILSIPEMCDVTFLVGPKEIPVHGLKAVLSVRSRWVFDIIWQYFLQDCMCAQRRLRSACAYAQSDQSLRWPSEDALDRWIPKECPAKTLIRLGGCLGLSESHYENMPIQIYWKFSHQKMKIFR